MLVVAVKVEAGPHSVPRKTKGSSYRVHSADGCRELVHLSGRSYAHTLKLIEAHAKPGERFLISGKSLKTDQRGNIRLYNYLSGAGPGYADMPCTLEVQAQDIGAKERLKPTAAWGFYPFLKKPRGKTVLSEPPQYNPASLLIYLHKDHQKLAWAQAPRAKKSERHHHLWRVRKLQQLLISVPEALRTVLRIAADDHAVYEYLHSDRFRQTLAKVGDAADGALAIDRDEVRLYCSSIRRHMRSNGGRDPFGFNIELAPAPKQQISTDEAVFPKTLVERYVNPELLPQSYADILATLHHWKISDITSVLQGLSKTAHKNWSPEYFMQLVIDSWRPRKARKHDSPFLVHLLGKGKNGALGFKKVDLARIKPLANAQGVERLQRELPVLVHFAKRVAHGEPPIGSLVAQTLMAHSPVQDKLAILEACQRNNVIDQHTADMLRVRRPVDVVLEAIETSDQHGTAQKTLCHYEAPDDVVLSLVAKRWGDEANVLQKFTEDARRHDARKFLKTVDTFRDAGLIAADALSPIKLTNPGTIELNEDAITHALVQDPSTEMKLTKAAFAAIRAKNPQEITPNQFDRLADLITIDRLHTKQNILIHWVDLKRTLRKELNAEAAAKMTNDGLNTALANHRPVHELTTLVEALAREPAIKQRHMRVAMTSPLLTYELLAAIEDAGKRDAKGKELELLLRKSEKKLDWDDIAWIVQNNSQTSLYDNQLAQIVDERMEKSVVAPFRKAISPLLMKKRSIVGLHEIVRVPKPVMTLSLEQATRIIGAVMQTEGEQSISDESIAEGTRELFSWHERFNQQLNGKLGWESFVHTVQMVPDIFEREISLLVSGCIPEAEIAAYKDQIFDHLIKPTKFFPANDEAFSRLAGISPPQLARILRFFAQDKIRDSGMPLATAERLVERMAARMDPYHDDELPKLVWQDIGWILENFTLRKKIEYRTKFIEKIIESDEVTSVRGSLQRAFKATKAGQKMSLSNSPIAKLPQNQRVLIIGALMKNTFKGMVRGERDLAIEQLLSMFDESEEHPSGVCR